MAATQIVEITQQGYFLGKTRGFLEVREKKERRGQVPLDDIAAVMVSVPGCSISTSLIDELALRNIPLVICGRNFLPNGWFLPTVGKLRQFHIMQAQAHITEPQRKQAWKKVVSVKIKNQSALLQRVGRPCERLNVLARSVLSGDTSNIEAQAARLYWPILLGDDFKRNRQEGEGLNAALNYTYAVVRAGVARALCAAGLHPSFSLHHKNPQNPLNLVDDVMEMFRPTADAQVYELKHKLTGPLDSQLKPELACVLNAVLPVADENSPLTLAAEKVCRSLAQYYLGELDNWAVPELALLAAKVDNKLENNDDADEGDDVNTTTIKTSVTSG